MGAPGDELADDRGARDLPGGEFGRHDSGYQRCNPECGCSRRPRGRGREDTAMRIARITRRVASVVGEMNYAQRRLVAVLMGCKDT